MQEYIFDYKDYKKRIKKPIKFNITLTTILIIILLGLCVFLSQPKVRTTNFYFVEIGKFQTFSQANKMATEISLKNGAGFVYFDNNYHVLAGFYPDKNSAEKVSKNISNEYPKSTVFCLSATQFYQNKSFSKNKNDLIQNLCDVLTNIETSLYEISILLDTNNNSYKTIKTKLNSLLDIYSSNFANLKNEIKTDTNNINILKKALEINNSLSRITEANEQSLPQKIKYETINIVVNHAMILDEIS